MGKPSSASHIRILIADDEAMFRSGLRLTLEREGFHVIAECADGMEAVAASEAMQEDIAILDLFMPNLNGIECARRISCVSPRTRCILISQYENPSTSVDKLMAAFAGAVHKGEAAEVLIEAIREVNRGARYWSRFHSSAGQRPQVPLSRREQQVLSLLVEGNSMTAIAAALGLSVKTVEGHRSSLTSKLQIRDIPGLVRHALLCGLITAP